MQRILIFIISWCLINYLNITLASPCKTTIRKVEPYQNRECNRWFLGWCTRYVWVWRYRETYTQTCCQGYGGSNCQPVCNPACQNGGVCVSPNTCRCPPGRYTGPNCNTPVCNPACQNEGVCVSPNTCRCPPGRYTGPNCNTLSYHQSQFNGVWEL